MMETGAWVCWGSHPAMLKLRFRIGATCLAWAATQGFEVMITERISCDGNCFRMICTFHQREGSSQPYKVVALLVNLVMGMPGLDYAKSSTLQRLELFAGDCSVSRGEHMDSWGAAGESIGSKLVV